jgi:ribose-phosphate pyrophosphokinase
MKSLKYMLILKTPETEQFVENMNAFLQKRLRSEYERADTDGKSYIGNILDNGLIGSVNYSQFRNLEIKPPVKKSVRQMDVYLVHSFCGYDGKSYDPNIGYMKLFLINDALKRAKASEIINVLPHIPYQRQDRKDEPRVPISAKVMATLTESSGGKHFDGILTSDMHSSQQQGFYEVAVDTLECAPLFMNYLAKQGFDAAETAVVSPDAGGAGRLRAYAKRFGLKRAILDKYRERAGEAEVTHLIGEVGPTCIIIDDIVDSGNTIVAGAEKLREAGARDIYVFATHWIATDGAEQKLRNAGIKVVTTDSIPRSPEYNAANKDFLTQLTLAPIFADAIFRSQIGESLRPLYEPEYVKELYSNFYGKDAATTEKNTLHTRRFPEKSEPQQASPQA